MESDELLRAVLKLLYDDAGWNIKSEPVNAAAKAIDLIAEHRPELWEANSDGE